MFTEQDGIMVSYAYTLWSVACIDTLWFLACINALWSAAYSDNLWSLAYSDTLWSVLIKQVIRGLWEDSYVELTIHLPSHNLPLPSSAKCLCPALETNSIHTAHCETGDTALAAVMCQNNGYFSGWAGVHSATISQNPLLQYSLL